MNSPDHSYEYIAIDIAKETLQVQTSKQSFVLDQTQKGYQQLCQIASQLTHPLVVMEASGGYERPLAAFLHQHGVALAVVNPRRIRGFAASESIKAKTDPIDARLILAFAQEKALRPDPVPEPVRQDLADLLDRRNQLNSELGRERTRLHKASKITRASLKRTIKHLETEIGRLDKAIRALVAADEDLKAQDATLQAIKGVGEITSWSVLAYLGEITHRPRNKVVALAGLAPYNRDTGKTQGKRVIHGGRAKLRKVLFMSARVAATHNPVIKAYVQRLTARGMLYKCALVAAMRKLLIFMQSQLRKQQKHNSQLQPQSL